MLLFICLLPKSFLTPLKSVLTPLKSFLTPLKSGLTPIHYTGVGINFVKSNKKNVTTKRGARRRASCSCDIFVLFHEFSLVAIVPSAKKFVYIYICIYTYSSVSDTVCNTMSSLQYCMVHGDTVDLII